jgi:hypothetical protein
MSSDDWRLIGLMRELRHYEVKRVDWIFTLTAAVHGLVHTSED